MKGLLKLRRVWLVGTGALVLVLALLVRESASKTQTVSLPSLVEDIKADKVQAMEVQGEQVPQRL